MIILRYWLLQCYWLPDICPPARPKELNWTIRYPCQLFTLHCMMGAGFIDITGWMDWGLNQSNYCRETLDGKLWIVSKLAYCAVWLFFSVDKSFPWDIAEFGQHRRPGSPTQPVKSLLTLHHFHSLKILVLKYILHSITSLGWRGCWRASFEQTIYWEHKPSQ